MTLVTVVSGDLPQAAADAFVRDGIVAIDTETSGLDWRTAELQLCQLYSEPTGAVLVRDVRSYPRQLARVLRSEEVLKAFHFAPFDLRFIASKWGIDVVRLACTKAASKLLDPELPADAHTLESISNRYLQVSLSKGSVRTSDWGAAELTAEQLSYAVADVEHLPALLQQVESRLRSAGKYGTWRAVCDYMPIAARLAVDGVPDPLVY
ncbi:hypothetical protein ACH3VR_09175 [Microbacterium sp. B2969]|uniref:ENTH domain-containing protein n=1 Tax=Microbacterium alkaliflavum TaxID=3248839 RepID=A0ABW7Q6Q1_9MICO